MTLIDGVAVLVVLASVWITVRAYAAMLREKAYLERSQAMSGHGGDYLKARYFEVRAQRIDRWTLPRRWRRTSAEQRRDTGPSSGDGEPRGQEV